MPLPFAMIYYEPVVLTHDLLPMPDQPIRPFREWT